MRDGEEVERIGSKDGVGLPLVELSENTSTSWAYSSQATSMNFDSIKSTQRTTTAHQLELEVWHYRRLDFLYLRLQSYTLSTSVSRSTPLGRRRETDGRLMVPSNKKFIYYRVCIALQVTSRVSNVCCYGK
ncbi:hypothetical protein Tco_0286305 [Tanacetum coccineum]